MNINAIPFAVFGGLYKINDVFPNGEPKWNRLNIKEDVFKNEVKKASDFEGVSAHNKLHFQICGDTLDMILYSGDVPRMAGSGKPCPKEMKHVITLFSEFVELEFDDSTLLYIIEDGKAWFKAWDDKGEAIILEDADPCPEDTHWDATLRKCVPDDI